MRVAAFIGAMLLATALTIGGSVLLVLLVPERDASAVWLAFAGLAVLVYGPLVVGVTASSWDVRASSESWRCFRTWSLVLLALQVLGVAATVVFSVLIGAPWWVPAAATALAAVLNVAAFRIGSAVRLREDARRGPPPPWRPISRESVVRRVLVIAAVFAAGLVAALAAALLLIALTGGSTRSLVAGLLFAVTFALMAAALTCVLMTLRLLRMLREQAGRDAARLRRIARIVLRDRPIPLEPGDRVAAARYAAVARVTLPFTFAYVVLLYLALALQQVAQLIDHPDAVFPRIFLVALVAILLGLVPLQLRRFRRVGAYARAHADDLVPADDETGGDSAVRS